MFTGLVEEIGTMRRMTRQGQAMVLTIGASKVLEGVKLGDSIAVNGVCLTVIAFDGSSMTVDVMPETFRKTTLRQLAIGSPINLERAMQAGGRFGGHIVQGHVDGVGTIVSRKPEDNAIVFRIQPERPELMKYVISHGSITLDGISLTVVHAAEDYFTVSIIPHTLEQTILRHKQPGESVNIECDVLGKYIERLLQFGISPAGGDASEPAAGRKSGLTASFLVENGFM